MDQTQLRTGTGGGTQGQAISQGNIAQPAPEGDPGGTPIGQVQPGVTGSALGPQTGISLNTTVLPNVKLNLSTSTIAASAPASRPATKPHHISPVLISIPVILVLIALVSFWQANRSVKSTTGY